MAQIIANGGNKTQEDAYTGPANEIRVDQSNQNLRLHNGSTPGGTIIQNRNQADARYQAKNAELSGFGLLEPQERGFMVRLGPADYVLRTIRVNVQQLSISNGDGYADSPTIGLASTITTEHTWTGQHIFDEVVQFNNGINANVSGDTSGTHTGDVVGNVTGDLTGDANGNHTGSFTGDLDVRGQTIQFDAGQIPAAAIDGLEDLIGDAGVRVGCIIMWGGAVDNIPAGYALCNGLNGTPDLRDKFILGAGGAVTAGSTGGEASVTPSVTVASDGAHTHNLSGNSGSALAGVTLTKTMDPPVAGGGTQIIVRNVTASETGHTHPTMGTADSAGAHTHTATAESIDLLPPYYALCFIMRIAI
jgi:hypothetical protein